MSLYPLVKEEAGNTTWKSMHHRASLYPDSNPTQKQKEHMKEFIYESLQSISLLCDDCKRHIHDYLKNNPLIPALENKETLSKYLCDFHNNVNARTGKEIHDCTKILRTKEEAHRNECKDCKVASLKKVIRNDTQNISVLKDSFDKFKEVSVKVFHALCDKYKIPYPTIKFHECPNNPLNSCTSMWLDAATQDIIEKPVVYLHPNVFGLRTIVHEFLHYAKQLSKDTLGGLDEESVERETQSLLNHEFPFDEIDKKDLRNPIIKQPTTTQIVKQDTVSTSRLRNFPLSSRIYDKYLYNVKRRDYTRNNNGEQHGDWVLDMFKNKESESPVVQEGLEQLESMERMEEARQEQKEIERSTHLFSFLDGLYSPFASIFGIKSSDMNQTNTPILLSNASLAIVKTHLSPIGSLILTSLASLGIYGALALSKTSLSYGDKLLMNNFGSQFLWSSLDYIRPENKQDIIDGAMNLGTVVSQQQWQYLPQLLLGDSLSELLANGFSGTGETSTSSSTSQLSAARNLQRASLGGGSGSSGRGSSSAGSNTIKRAAIDTRQQMSDLRNLQREMESSGGENVQARGRNVKTGAATGGNPADVRRGRGIGVGGTGVNTMPMFGGDDAVMIPSDDDMGGDEEEEYESSFGMHVADGRSYSSPSSSSYSYGNTDSYTGDIVGTRRNTIRDVFNTDPMYDNFNDVYYEDDEYYG